MLQDSSSGAPCAIHPTSLKKLSQFAEGFKLHYIEQCSFEEFFKRLSFVWKCQKKLAGKFVEKCLSSLTVWLFVLFSKPNLVLFCTFRKSFLFFRLNSGQLFSCSFFHVDNSENIGVPQNVSYVNNVKR